MSKLLYTIVDTDPESPHHGSPYLTRFRLGRLMIHVFHRQDYDDPHDHPYDFWTFPLHSYVEEVFQKNVQWAPDEPVSFYSYRRVVRAFRWHHRPAEFVHRIRGRYSGKVWDKLDKQIIPNVRPDTANDIPEWEPYHDEYRKFVTIVWRSRERREWGFWKFRALQWCWQVGRDYYRGGKRDDC